MALTVCLKAYPDTNLTRTKGCQGQPCSAVLVVRFFAIAKGSIPMSTVAAPPVNKIPQFINGQWVGSQAAEWQDIINPATAEVLGRVPISDATEVARAIDAAQAAY